jgi:hypothetical protein
MVTHAFADVQSQVATDTHMAFYATVASVFAFLLVALNIEMFGKELGRKGPSGRTAPEVWVGLIVLMTFGLGIPLAILAGFLRDSHIWRLLAFISLIVEAALAVFVSGLALAEPSSSSN